MTIKRSIQYEKAADAIRETNAYKEERIKSDFTERIYNRLSEMKMSQAEFARRLGVTPARVTKILSGDANFTFRSAALISTALGMDFEAALVPKSGSDSTQGRIVVGYAEGVLGAKVNSSWRTAEFAPQCRKPVEETEFTHHEYASTAVA